MSRILSRPGSDNVISSKRSCLSSAAAVDTAGKSSTDIGEYNDDESSTEGFYYLRSRCSRMSVRMHQYKGEDKSLLYKYILSPFASFCVNRLTSSKIAPNTITLTGLVFMVASYMIFWYYVPTLHDLRPLHHPEVFGKNAFLNSNEEISDGSEGSDVSGSIYRSDRLDASDINDTNDTNETLVSDDMYPPRWTFLYCAAAILIYQTLDNMDGKQARRTKSSTPLGLLFDHGCDSINSLFGSVNWMIALGLRPDNVNNSLDLLLCTIMLFGPYALFYVGTWEEYYTGALILPVVNGPNEGLLIASIVKLTSYLYGPSFWHTTSWSSTMLKVLGYPSTSAIPATVSTVMTATNMIIDPTALRHIRNADWLIIASMIGFIQECSSKIFGVVRAYGFHTLLNLTPFVTLIACYIYIGIASGSAIASSDTIASSKTSLVPGGDNGQSDGNLILWLAMPRTGVHLCAALFVEMVTDLMLCHISSQSYQPFRWIMLPLIFLCVWIHVAPTPTITSTHAVGTALSPSLSSMPTTSEYLLVYTGFVISYVAMKTTIVVHEMCAILNIWCFDITSSPPQERRQQYHQTQDCQKTTLEDNLLDNTQNHRASNRTGSFMTISPFHKKTS